MPFFSRTDYLDFAITAIIGLGYLDSGTSGSRFSRLLIWTTCENLDRATQTLIGRLKPKKYTSFTWQRLANELKLLPPYKKSSSSAVAAASTSQVSIRLECSLCESYSPSYFCSIISSHQVSSTSSAQNWHPKTDGARLIMCLIILREEFSRRVHQKLQLRDGSVS